MPTLSRTLDGILASAPPRLLFHYTSPHGLIGIAMSKEAWASNLWYVSDAKEIDHAVDMARLAIENLLRSQAWPEDEREVLNEMSQGAGSAAKRIYAFSLSEERDLLSQWRAYCPASGGYAIGFPSVQLVQMARKQSFYLSRCEYDYRTQYQIVSEFIAEFLEEHRRRRGTNEPRQPWDTVPWRFAQHLARFGPVIKHDSFREEREWRLVSSVTEENHPQVDFRPGPKGIIPYFRFRLTDDEDPDLVRAGDDTLVVVAGPAADIRAATIAAQFLLKKYLPGAAHSATATPYRTW